MFANADQFWKKKSKKLKEKIGEKTSFETIHIGAVQKCANLGDLKESAK